VELKFRNSVFIKEQAGEFLLSRELMEISTAHDAQAVIVGTYTETRNELYVSSRIVHAKSGKIISSFDYLLPLDNNLKTLLRS
jgi:TolB-like protein